MHSHFFTYVPMLDHFSYKLHVTNLFHDGEEIVEAFLERYDFETHEMSFEEFRYQYLLFKIAFIHNTLPFYH